MKICLIGCSSTIVKAFKDKLIQNTKDIDFVHVCRSFNSDYVFNIEKDHSEFDYEVVPVDCDFYLISIGVLFPKRILDQTHSERMNSINVNLLAPVLISEMLLKQSKKARIVILGSESGQKGSFDTTYFLSKAALSAYVRERQISFPGQSLNMVSPSTVIDTEMTQSRDDLELLNKRLKSMPKQRGAYSSEVAEVIGFLFEGGDSYICNEEISINGGKFARMIYGE